VYNNYHMLGKAAELCATDVTFQRGRFRDDFAISSYERFSKKAWSEENLKTKSGSLLKCRKEEVDAIIILEDEETRM